MGKNTCFVISPIGLPDTDVREHANDVFDYIIKPACDAAGVAAIRADQDTRPGKITDQMYDCILGDDLLIAVLTYYNPNVFYEVAIAEAAARPIILMIEQGATIPFDIKDRRVMEYDLKPRSLMQGTHKELLTRAIKDLQLSAGENERSVPFRPALSPLGAEKVSPRIWRRANEVDPEEPIRIIDQAEEFLKFRGIAFFQVPMKDAFLDQVKATLDRGVRAQVLLMDPANPVLEHQLREFSTNYVAQIQEEILSGIEMWTRVLDGCGEIRIQTKGFMSGLAQFNEKEALLSEYAISIKTIDSPCALVGSNDPDFVRERLEFDFVWSSLSKPASEASV